jgi:hypothetical protein
MARSKRSGKSFGQISLILHDPVRRRVLQESMLMRRVLLSLQQPSVAPVLLNVPMATMSFLPRIPGAHNALRYPPSELAPLGTGGLPLSRRLAALGGWLRAAIAAMADHYAAMAMYEQLSRLSDAELTRRGLSRESLARDIRAACDRTERRRAD